MSIDLADLLATRWIAGPVGEVNCLEGQGEVGSNSFSEASEQSVSPTKSMKNEMRGEIENYSHLHLHLHLEFLMLVAGGQVMWGRFTPYFSCRNRGGTWESW